MTAEAADCPDCVRERTPEEDLVPFIVGGAAGAAVLLILVILVRIHLSILFDKMPRTVEFPLLALAARQHGWYTRESRKLSVNNLQNLLIQMDLCKL